MTMPKRVSVPLQNEDIFPEPVDGVFMPSPNGMFYGENLCVRPRERVLDIGTGTGVLAIMAAKNGCRAEATDTDSRAIAAAQRNAQLNGVQISVHRGSLFADTTPPYDVVFANLPNEIVAPAHLADLEERDAQVFSSGPRGNELILELLHSAWKYMHSESRLYVPIHSLTAYHDALGTALRYYRLRLVAFRGLPVKPFVTAHLDFYSRLNTEGTIQIFQKNGAWFSYGYVYEATLSTTG